MDIKNLITYLKEELKDIPAVPKNIHYTNFESLYYILQSGLKGQEGGYPIKSPKTKSLFDMELATVRNSHKLSKNEQKELSLGATGGIRINLFTDRILAAHRGTRKDTIAELPAQRKKFIKGDKQDFKERYGFDIPDFTEGPNHTLPKNFNEDYIQKWLIANKKPAMNNTATWLILHHNRDIKEYYKELRNREREERFILKRNIPINPDFMQIIIEKDPSDMSEDDSDFVDEVYKNYLALITKYAGVFEHNDNYRKFKNLLRNKLRGNK